MKDANVFYQIGRRDAIAEVLMLFRMNGDRAIVELAKELLRVLPDHPHAKWVLEKDETK